MPRALIPIFLVVVVDVLGMTIILPLLPFYAEHLGASPTMVGLLVSTFAVCQLIGGPVLGRLSDHVGRRPLLLVSQTGTLIGFIILAYANSLFLVFVSRVIDGFTAGNISLAQAYITDVTKPEERTKSFAFIGIAFGLGFLIGPAASGFLYQFGYVYPVLAAIGLSTASIATTYFLLPGTTSSPAAREAAKKVTIFDWRNYVRYFREPGLGPLLWQFFTFLFAFAVFMSGFPLFAERRYVWNGRPFGPTEVGYVYAFIGVLGIIMQGGLVGRMSHWWGDWRVVRGSFFCSAIVFAAIAFTFDVASLLWAAAGITFATGAIRPALTSLITRVSPQDEQGAVLGLAQSLQSVAQIIGPFIGGIMIDHGQLKLWAGTAAVSCVIGFAVRKPAAIDAPAAMARSGT